MEVTNHATGDRCVLTFKPRGWRGKDAFEIRGSVYDAQGKLCWDIAGRWNSQLVARKVGAGSGDLNPDQSVEAPDGQIAVAQPLAEYLLLWRNSEKPPTPFNLTPFAITLNSCPDDLRPWLAPTDCRLRPDLSAFESGKFDQANDLKQKLENHQRETRRKREQASCRHTSRGGSSAPRTRIPRRRCGSQYLRRPTRVLAARRPPPTGPRGTTSVPRRRRASRRTGTTSTTSLVTLRCVEVALVGAAGRTAGFV